MSKLSKEEVAARRKRMQEEALKSVAKTEQLNIRIDENSIARLYTLAGKQGKPVGTMVREWILDRLLTEEQPGGDESLKVLVDLVSDLHQRIDRWDHVLLDGHAAGVQEDASKSYITRSKRSGKSSSKRCD
jgi:hypothetical protein